GEPHARASQPEPREVLHVVFAGTRAHLLYLGAVLARMRVHDPAVAGGQLPHAAQHLVAAGEDEARAERPADAAVRGPVPAPPQPLRRVQRSAGFLAKPRRGTGGVHQALAAGVADAA